MTATLHAKLKGTKKLETYIYTTARKGKEISSNLHPLMNTRENLKRQIKWRIKYIHASKKSTLIFHRYFREKLLVSCREREKKQ